MKEGDEAEGAIATEEDTWAEEKGGGSGGSGEGEGGKLEMAGFEEEEGFAGWFSLILVEKRIKVRS